MQYFVCIVKADMNMIIIFMDILEVLNAPAVNMHVLSLMFSVLQLEKWEILIQTLICVLMIRLSVPELIFQAYIMYIML